MTLSEKQHEELLDAAKPLMKWLADNCHPHCSATVESDSVELVEGISRQTTLEFIKD